MTDPEAPDERPSAQPEETPEPDPPAADESAETADSEPADSEPAAPETADSEPADSEPADSEVLDSEALDSEALNSEVLDSAAAAPGSDAGSETPDSGVTTSARKRMSTAGAVIGLLVGLLGFALVVQLRSNTRDAQLENARQDDLVRILSDLNARETRLHGEISQLEQLQSQLRSGAQGREAALADARRRADELGILAGTLPAEGTGLRIQFVPGAGRSIPAMTVLEAVEELRGAGAEAMQIEGANGAAVRIIASTYFVDADGGGLNAGGTTLTGPYTITVIGPAQTMRTALTIPGGVADAVQRDGGNVIADEPGVVHVDALHTGSPLQYAQPVS